MKTKITTSDIYFVAALISYGNKIDQVDRADSRHMQFTLIAPDNFQSANIPKVSTNLDQLESSWADGSLVVNAVAFKHAFQYVQSVIHSK